MTHTRAGSWTFLLATALAAGCAKQQVKGDIDGDSLKAKSALFFTDQGAFGEDGLLTIVLSELDDACQDYGYYLAATDGMTDPADLARNWGAVFSNPDYWEVAIFLRTPDPETSLAGFSMRGLDIDEALEGANEAYALFIHNTGLRDEAYFDGSGPAADYYTSYLSRGGRVEISKHTPASYIHGGFGTEVMRPGAEGEKPSQVGLVDMSFNAVFCEVDLL